MVLLGAFRGLLKLFRNSLLEGLEHCSISFDNCCMRFYGWYSTRLHNRIPCKLHLEITQSVQ